MTEPRIRPLPLVRNLDFVPEASIERIHEASLTVLARTGMQVRSETLVKALEAEGAETDLDSLRVRFPRDMVEEAIERAPSSFTMFARDPDADVVLDGSSCYLTCDGCASEVVDPRTGVMRPSTKQDLMDTTRLADAIPEISIAWQPCAARDVPTHVQPLHELHAQFLSTSKNIQQMTVIEPHHARAAVEMAAAVAGGEDELRRRPILSAFQCTLSPLTLDGGPLESAIIYGAAGIPCGIVVMPLTGATAPMTVAGTLVLQNAELLGAITCLEFLSPGIPTFYGVCTSTMDLNSGSLALGWGPEEQLYSFASAQLARRYRIPSQLGTFGTGAKTQDWQAGAQHALSGLTSYLAAGDMLCASGTVYGGRVFTFENMLLDSELLDIAVRVLEGFPDGEDELAVDAIDEVGPGGHFLAADHTLRHMRELWQTRFFGRESWEDWEAAGRPEPKHRARDRALEILEEHRPMPLPAGAEEELARIIEHHTREGAVDG
jgi:trimethylamine--corrinoid protein Co-methyltransferase